MKKQSQKENNQQGEFMDLVHEILLKFNLNLNHNPHLNLGMGEPSQLVASGKTPEAILNSIEGQ